MFKKSFSATIQKAYILLKKAKLNAELLLILLFASAFHDQMFLSAHSGAFGSVGKFLGWHSDLTGDGMDVLTSMQ